jgi:hypothetical protein
LTPQEVQQVWQASLEAAQDPDLRQRRAAAHQYLTERKLDGAILSGHLGVLPAEAPLPDSIARWRLGGYVLIAALYNQGGSVSTLQARCIQPTNRKVLFPPGSLEPGVVFANSTGLDVLRGAYSGSDPVLFAEGITDFWALTLVFSGPVLGAPGTAFVGKAIGPWAKGQTILLALDCDPPGDRACQVAASALSAYGIEAPSRIRWPEALKDACDVLGRRGVDGFRQVIDYHVKQVGRA